MARNPLSRIRLVYRRSSPLLKGVVLAAIVLSTAALITMGAAIRNTREKTEDARRQAARLEELNQELQDRINDLGSVQSVEQIAREELGLVDPDTVIFEPVD